MMIFEDFQGRQVILTALAERHIVSGHHEIAELGIHQVIEETLISPDIVVRRNRAFHYYRMRLNTPFGDKYVRVVVTEYQNARHVRTAFITSRIAEGEVVWEREA